MSYNVSSHTKISSSKLHLRYTGVGKGKFIVVFMEKDTLVMIITIALLTQNNAIATVNLLCPLLHLAPASHCAHISPNLQLLEVKNWPKKTNLGPFDNRI